MNDDQLEENKSVELGPEDAKIVQKRAKKHGLSPREAGLQRKQQLNLKQAQALIQEFNIKLNTLGFALQPVLNYSDYGIKPANNLRPLTLEESLRHDAMMQDMKVEPEVVVPENENEFIKDPKASPTEEDAKAVEPLNIPE